LYDCDCENCKTQTQTLAIGKSKIKPLLNAVETAFKQLHTKGSYKPEDLAKTKVYTDLVRETSGIFNGALTDNDIPPAMAKSLKEDVFLFSGLKTHAQLAEASKLLLTNEGKIKSFSAFAKDTESIKANYNQNYLEAEYQFAVSSAQSAGNWANISNDYDLQYRTAGDDRVRDSHEQLRDTTLPTDDAFWISYYPPNGWRCRCTAVQVRKGKYETSDSTKAIIEAEKATTQIGKNGENKLEIFRFNPGIQKVVFPPSHPYTKVAGAAQVRREIKASISTFTIEKELKTTKDLSDSIGVFAKLNPDYFIHGYLHTKTTSKRGVNGYTTMQGDIYLTKNKLKEVQEGFNNIRKGKPTTLNQEDSISTLHHEMWHNANKPGYVRMTVDQTKTMELANEFVSRKTLPEFMKKLGGKLENESLINNRESTGYNNMVINYDSLIDWSKADKARVLETVKEHLINGSYNNQMEGLVNAIKINSEFEIKEQTVKSLIKYAKDNRIDNQSYKEMLVRNDELLVKKKS
jgi:SPP1 gp7 family putative phage head morphogenesis protein